MNALDTVRCHKSQRERMGWATSGMGGADEIFNILYLFGEPSSSTRSTWSNTVSMHIKKKDPDPRVRSVRTHGMRKKGGIRWKFIFDVRKPLTVRQLWGFNVSTLSGLM